MPYILDNWESIMLNLSQYPIRFLTGKSGIPHSENRHVAQTTQVQITSNDFIVINSTNFILAHFFKIIYVFLPLFVE